MCQLHESLWVNVSMWVFRNAPQWTDAHHACSSSRSLQLFEEVLQLLPFDVAVSCRAAEELN